jgi:hypothetical protein
LGRAAIACGDHRTAARHEFGRDSTVKRGKLGGDHPLDREPDEENGDAPMARVVRDDP